MDGQDSHSAGLKTSKVKFKKETQLDKLDTVRALHETVVALRTALESSKEELNDLKTSTSDPDILRQTVERLSLENHVLRERVLSDHIRATEITQSVLGENTKIEKTEIQEDKIVTEIKREDNEIMEPSNKDETQNEPQSVKEEENVEETNVGNGKMANGPPENETIKEEQNVEEDNLAKECEAVSENDIKPDDKVDNNTCQDNEESEEEEEVDDIELIFTTDDTKELPTLQETLESITEDGPWDRNGVPILLKYRAVNEFDTVAEEGSEYYNKQRRNTLPAGPREYRPIAHRDVIQGSRSQVLAARNGGESGPVRPILMERCGQNLIGNKRESTGAQTDITALPLQWKSESYLARHKVVAQNFTTLPSKFAIPAVSSRPVGSHTSTGLRLSEKTREARRALLSDLGFTSMVPELSRSVDHLCRRGDAMLARSFPRALSYMKQIDSMDSSLASPTPRNGHGRWLCECLAHAGSSYYPGMWDSTGSSLMQRPPTWSPLTPQTPCDRGNYI